MHPASSNRRQVCATMGHPSNSTKSLSTWGPMRVPLPAATMMAEIINRPEGAGLARGFQAARCACRVAHVALRKNRATIVSKADTVADLDRQSGGRGMGATPSHYHRTTIVPRSYHDHITIVPPCQGWLRRDGRWKRPKSGRLSGLVAFAASWTVACILRVSRERAVCWRFGWGPRSTAAASCRTNAGAQFVRFVRQLARHPTTPLPFQGHAPPQRNLSLTCEKPRSTLAT